MKFISFSGNLCYQQPPLLWAYLHGEKVFLVGGFPSLPCRILLSSLPFEEGLLFCSLKLPFSTYVIVTGSWQSPIFNLLVIYRILTVSLIQFTCYLQDLGSLPFSIYMLFTGSWQSPFLNLHVIYRILTVFLFQFSHVIYRILTVSLFEFTCYLQDLDSIPFSIYMLLTVPLFQFTCYLQNLDSVPFLIYMLFTESWQSPFFNLHVIYRILTVSLFEFTCYLQDLDSLPFSIYMLLTVSLFLFTCYLRQGLKTADWSRGCDVK